MFAKVTRDEHGIAMITAIIVSMVILFLITVVVQLSIHNVERSADDRRRVQAIDAAEAGIDYYFSYLTETEGQDPVCQITRSMPGSNASFTATAYFWNGSTNIACTTTTPPRLPPDVTPTSVMIYSEGKTGTATPVRKMQAYANLTVSKGKTFDNTEAIFAENSVNFTSNARLGGSQYSDANIWSNGDYTLASNSTIFGKVTARGSVTLRSNSEVKKQVWAGGSITLQTRASIGKAVGTGEVAKASTGSISLASPSYIYGDAKAQGTITGGTVYGDRNAGQPSDAPPARPYPTFTYCDSGCVSSPTKWSTAGYTIAPTFSGATACTDAVNYITSTWTSGSLLVRVANPACTVTFNGGTHNVKGNLAIISDGPVELRTNARFVPSPSTGFYNVFVFAGLSGTAPCNFTSNANSGFNPGLAALIYVPSGCTIDLLSNSTIAQGQLIGGTINFKHTVAMNFQPVTVPGEGIGGFKQDVKCKREINQLPPLPSANC
jgi:Tfp pilus assembly protein PilX